MSGHDLRSFKVTVPDMSRYGRFFKAAQCNDAKVLPAEHTPAAGQTLPLKLLAKSSITCATIQQGMDLNMIFLHVDDNARARIDRLAEESGGSVLGIDLNVAQSIDANVINKWLCEVSDPKLIVVLNARAKNRDERRSFESMRRVAKFRGIDVHMTGDRTVEHVADQIVHRDEDLNAVATGSSVGKQIADLVQSEKMTRFERAEMDIPTLEEAMTAGNLSAEDAQQQIDWMKAQAVYVNNLYQVNIEFMADQGAHLMIRRIDRQPIHNWSHFQQIKNELLGEECEAIEIYPKVSRLVDDKNHYHLWGSRSPAYQFPFGIESRKPADA